MNKLVVLILLIALMLTPPTTGRAASLKSAPVSVKAEQKHGKSQLSYKTIAYTRKEEAYSVSVKYPKFSGPSCKLASQLNKRIHGFVWSEMNKYLLGTNNFGPPPSKRDEWMNKYKIIYQYNCNYSVALATANFVSINFNFYTYTGGVHGNPYDLTFNYQLSPLKEISLERIFGNKQNLGPISDLCQIGLCQSLKSGDRESIVKGTEPVKNNLSVFTFDAEGITFIFQPYQVAPYCDGMPDVTLTWSKIKPLMVESSPLKSLAHNARADQHVLDPAWRTQEKESAFKALKKRSSD